VRRGDVVCLNSNAHASCMTDAEPVRGAGTTPPLVRGITAQSCALQCLCVHAHTPARTPAHTRAHHWPAPFHAGRPFHRRVQFYARDGPCTNNHARTYAAVCAPVGNRPHRMSMGPIPDRRTTSHIGSRVLTRFVVCARGGQVVLLCGGRFVRAGGSGALRGRGLCAAAVFWHARAAG
jgi:hypothetical protein